MSIHFSYIENQTTTQSISSYTENIKQWTATPHIIPTSELYTNQFYAKYHNPSSTRIGNNIVDEKFHPNPTYLLTCAKSIQ
jgi:hypothetical protein